MMFRLPKVFLVFIIPALGAYAGYMKWGIQGGVAVALIVLLIAGALYCLGRQAVDNFRYY
jgi:hypothetical protein